MWCVNCEALVFSLNLQGASSVSSLKVFTTQPETVYGVSFIAISTEHDICTRAGLLAPDVVHDLDKMRNSAALSYNRRKVLNKGSQSLLVVFVKCLFVLHVARVHEAGSKVVELSVISVYKYSHI